MVAAYNYRAPSGDTAVATRNFYLDSFRQMGSTPKRSKRRFSDDEDSFKKVRQTSHATRQPATPPQQLTLQNINLEEYGKFEHPDGGYIQFTPIGNVRTFTGDNNMLHRIVEENSSFDLAKTDRGIDGYKLYIGNHGFEEPASGVTIDCSPSNEIEGYMRTGYQKPAADSSCQTTNSVSYYNDGGSSAAKLSYYFNDESDFDDDEAMAE